MNEIRSRHLVERAALRLRGELGRSDAAGKPAPVGVAERPAAAPPPLAPPLPAPPPEVAASVAPAASPATPLPAGGEPVSMAALRRAGLTLGGPRRTRIAEEFSVSAGALLRAVRAAQREAQLATQAGAAAGGAAAPPGSGGGVVFGNLMLVTSAQPNEGKTFSALNLAATLAHNGLARVVLVDIDSKPSSLTAQLGLDGRPGLFDLAADPRLAPDSVLVGTAIRDLAMLPLGTRDPEGSLHGLTRKLATAVERIARRLSGHLVVLDAPPCLATSEPSALAPMVGLVALVVEAERTQREEIEAAIEMVATCPNVMLLLNKVRGTRGHAFGYYDYYGA